MKKIYPLFISVIYLYGCSATVNLTLRNEENTSLTTKVQLIDDDEIRKEEILLGDITSKESMRRSFKIEKGGSFIVYSSIPNSAGVYKSSQITVTGDPDPFETAINIKIQCQVLDDSKSFSTISQSFKNLGENIGAPPLALKNALETRIGSLVVADPGGENRSPKIIFTLPPNQLGVKVLKLDDVFFPGTNEDEEVIISGLSAINANTNILPFGKFGFNFKETELYHLRWVMRGFGQLSKQEDSDKNVIAKFNSLDTNIIANIKNILSTNPKAKLYYINNFYVLDRAELFVKTANKITAGSDVDVANVFAGNAVFTFENSSERNLGYGPVVLNFWGDELNLITTTLATIKRPAPLSLLSEDNFLRGIKTKTVDLLLFTGKRIAFSPNDFE